MAASGNDKGLAAPDADTPVVVKMGAMDDHPEIRDSAVFNYMQKQYWRVQFKLDLDQAKLREFNERSEGAGSDTNK